MYVILAVFKAYHLAEHEVYMPIKAKFSDWHVQQNTLNLKF